MSKKTSKSTQKARQASAKVHFDSTGKNMTSKAGLIPVVKSRPSHVHAVTP